METIKILIIALASLTNIIQSTPINIKHSSRINSLFSKSKPLESMSAWFFKLIPERSTKTNVKRVNTTLPTRKAVKADFVIQSVKPTLHNVPTCKHSDYTTKYSSFITVPVMHPFDNYKIIVVTAPPYIKLRGGDSEPLAVYLIFNYDTSDDTKAPSMPEVYFVTQHNGRVDLSLKNKKDEIFVINSNRTVTGLKSRDVEKFVSFKRKQDRSRLDVAWRPIGP